MLSANLLVSIPQAIRIIRKFSTSSVAGSLTLQQLRILLLVKEGYGTTQIAETIHVSLAAVSRMASVLVKRELLTREPGADKRAQVLKLTSSGKKILSFVKKQVERTLDKGISKLTPKEQDCLAQGLVVLDKLMSLVKKE